MIKFCGFCKNQIKNAKTFAPEKEGGTTLAETCSAQCMKRLLSKMLAEGRLSVSPDGVIKLSKN